MNSKLFSFGTSEKKCISFSYAFIVVPRWFLIPVNIVLEFSFTRLIVEDMLFHWNLLQGCTWYPSLSMTGFRPKAQCSTFQSWDWWWGKRQPSLLLGCNRQAKTFDPRLHGSQEWWKGKTCPRGTYPRVVKVTARSGEWKITSGRVTSPLTCYNRVLPSHSWLIEGEDTR